MQILSAAKFSIPFYLQMHRRLEHVSEKIGDEIKMYEKKGCISIQTIYYIMLRNTSRLDFGAHKKLN